MSSAQPVIDAEYLKALGEHLSRGLLALSPRAIADVRRMDVRHDIATDATLVLVTLSVSPAFI